jgi:hypothetical protein
LWEVVRDFARSLQKGGSLGQLEYEETAPGIVAVNVMADLKAGPGIDLQSLLVKTRAYQASLPVDKVFALMNLASNPEDVGVQVDYSTKALELWERIATHSLVVHAYRVRECILRPHNPGFQTGATHMNTVAVSLFTGKNISELREKPKCH